MSKITKSNTKEEILTALDKALEEQDILHNEVESLQVIVDDLGKETARKDNSITNLESLVQEEDVKKKDLIKELANQSADIELAKQQTGKLDKLALQLGEVNTTVDSAKKELNSKKNELFVAQKKIELLSTELESFKNRALPSDIKKGFRRFFNFKKMAFVSVIIFITIVIGAVYVTLPDRIIKLLSRVQENGPVEIIDPLAGMSFTETDGIITARHDKGGTLQTKDGISIDDSVIVKWATKAGFDGVLFGTLENHNGKVILERSGSGKYEFSEMDINLIESRFKELSCTNVLAFVDNKDNIILPGIFSQTSQGNLEVFKSHRMLASFIPIFWGKEKTQMNIKSGNVYAYITSNEIFMEIKGIKASTTLNVVKGTRTSH
jgi:hypothetical protein